METTLRYSSDAPISGWTVVADRLRRETTGVTAKAARRVHSPSEAAARKKELAEAILAEAKTAFPRWFRDSTPCLISQHFITESDRVTETRFYNFLPSNDRDLGEGDHLVSLGTIGSCFAVIRRTEIGALKAMLKLVKRANEARQNGGAR